MNAPLHAFPPYWDGVDRSYIPPAELRISPSLRLHQGEAVEVDPITFSVIRYALMNANFEHSRLIQRLSVSPIVMLSRDFQASVMLEDGELAFLGPNIQYFSNAQSLTVKWILEHRSDSPGIAPGDIFLCNDPFIGAPHQQDTSLVHPVFVDGELFCWIGNTLHYADVGGVAPGSFCLAATDAWHDPTAFPAIELVDAGVIRRDVEEAFIRQSRVRSSVLMDLRAAVASIQTTARQVGALIAQYGPDRVKAVMRRTVDAGEALFTERLSHVPDGAWSARGYVEASVPGDWGIYRYQINIEKRGDTLYVDNLGSDPQAGCINITFVAFSGAVLTAIIQAIAPDLAGAYGGPHRRVVFRPESGLLNCAEYPAAVSSSGAVTSEMNINLATHAVARMLASGDEEARGRILGAPEPAFYACVYMGTDAQGVPFVCPASDNMIGSSGGMPGQDGVDAGGHYWMPGGISENVEQVEATYPLLYLYRRFQPGGHDGAGRHRGGLGLVQAITPWAAGQFGFALATNEGFVRANGVLGGNPGGRGYTRVLAGSSLRARFAAGEIPSSIDGLGGTEEVVDPKSVGLAVNVDDGVFEWSGAATGGFGDPLLRDPLACQKDVSEGLHDAKIARAAYGVVLRAAGEDGEWILDVEATRVERRRLAEARLGRPLSADFPDGAQADAGGLVRREGRWRCGCCDTDLGPSSGNYKLKTEQRSLGIDSFAPGFESPHPSLASQMELRMFLCGGCGVRLDTEITRKSDGLLHDMRVTD